MAETHFWDWPVPGAEISRAEHRGVTVIGSDDARDRISWAAILDRWSCLAGHLACSLGPGSTVLIVGPTSVPLVIALGASWLLGAAVSVAPLPLRLQTLVAYHDQLVARLEVLDPDITFYADSY